jgi:imidazolonepropionase-like amidohydrolase
MWRVILAILLWPAASLRAEPLTAITDVILLDGRGGAPVRGVTVVVRGTTIESVARKFAPLPAGARILKGGGRYLLPGFIDMHAHLLVPRCEPPAGQSFPFDRPLSERVAATLLAFGITTVRSPATPTVEGLRLRNDLNAGLVRGPRAFASAEFINDSRLDEQGLRAYVRDALRHRPDYFKVYSRLAPDQVAVVIDEAHRHKVPVIGHLQRTSWLEGALLGIDHLTHAVDWSEQSLKPEHRASYRSAIEQRGPMRARLDWLQLVDPSSTEITRMIAEIARRGISVDPTLVAYDSKFSDPAAARYRRNRYVDLVPELKADWLGCPGATSDWTPDDHRRWTALLPKLRQLVRMMHDAGVLLTTGSDLTNEWLIPGESLHQEFELLAEAGIPLPAILRMTGENAARALKKNDIGVVVPGRRADLVLLASDPLANIGNTRSIVWVMQGGRIVSGKAPPGSATPDRSRP